MKTYKIVVEEDAPRLKIYYDDLDLCQIHEPIGVIVTKNKYVIDTTNAENYQELYDVMIDTSEVNSAEKHMELIEKELKGEYKVYPINRGEHGNVWYKIGTSQSWDNGVCGYYFVKIDEVTDDTENIIKCELDDITAWTNCEIYRFTLVDDQGELIDSCGGFLDIDDIKNELPEEWKDEDMSNYLVY